jgi:hypothetical protein
MGNLCCNLSNQEKNHRYARLIDREAYNKISGMIDRSIKTSNLLSIIKENIDNEDVMEHNTTLIFQHNHRRDPQYGTILGKLEETDINIIIAKSLLSNIKEVTKGFNIILSRAKINPTKIPTDTENKNNEMNFIITIVISDTGLSNTGLSNTGLSSTGLSSLDDTPGIYNSAYRVDLGLEPKVLRKKDSETLYLKILKYNIPHQYDNDIIYQTESKNYFRSKECIICYERPANVLYLGCMHLQLCDKCHSNKKDPNHDSTLGGRRNCPMCNMWTGHKDFDWFIMDPISLDKKYPLLGGSN